MNHEQVAEILNDVADDLERGGWCQGAYFSGVHAACSLGAISRRVEIGLTEPYFNALIASHPVTLAFAKAIGMASIAPHIVYWNDIRGRTQNEVLDAFRLAAKTELRKADAE